MVLLVLDTTADRCGVLVRGPSGDVVIDENLERGHDARLAPMVAEALSSAGVRPRHVSRIIVATGPGSFTGVRVGVAFARGLALALKVPAVGVTTLDALAAMAGRPPLMAVAHDAKRGEVVWRAYRRGVPLTQPACDPIADAKTALDRLRVGGEVTLVGSGAPLLAGEGYIDAGLARFPLAPLVALGEHAVPERAPAEPFYHRPPDAKLPGGREPEATS